MLLMRHVISLTRTFDPGELLAAAVVLKAQHEGDD